MSCITNLNKVALGCVSVSMVTLTASAAQIAVVKKGESNAVAQAKFNKVLAQGGSITFEAGSWTINLDNKTRNAAADVTIIGQNKLDAAKPGLRGAYEDKSLVKTTLTMTGSTMNLTKGCSKLTMKNIKWAHAGIDVVDHHQLAVDLENVIFDIMSWPQKPWAKNVIRANDGIEGTIKHCSFLGFGMRAIAFNRSLQLNKYPLTSIGQLTVDHCKFNPDPTVLKAPGVVGINHDSGNDEYAPTFDHGNKQITNNLFIDSGICMSKASNITIAGNIFEFEKTVSEVLHLEEFSHDITVHDNIFRLKGGYEGNCVTLGALQTSYDITVTDNVVEQTHQLESFIAGAGVKNLTVNGNEIKNPDSQEKYISLWGVNNLNVKVGSDGRKQPGLEGKNVSIASSKKAAPIANGDYYMVWGKDQYLTLDNGNVTFVQSKEKPKGNKYRWKVVNDKVGYKSNFFTIKNLGGSGFFLEVFKGPNAAAQRAGIGKPYTYDKKSMYAKAVGTYKGKDRKPGFAIFKKGDKYCLLLGYNEKRSQLVNKDSKAQVYIVANEKDANYDWSFVKTSVDSGATDAPSDVSVSSVAIANSSVTLTKADQTKQLNATVAPANASDKKLTWSSSDESVATVNNSGKVIAVANGTAVITAASANNKKATATVTVDIPVVNTPDTDDSTTGGSTGDSTTDGNKDVVLSPVNDAYVKGSKGYNTKELRVESGKRTTYLQFDLSSLQGEIESMQLQMTVAGDAGNGTLNVAQTDDTKWTESGLSAANAPKGGAVLAQVTGSFAVGGSFNCDISKAVVQDGVLSLVITMNSGGNDVSFSSKEGKNAPVLTVKTVDTKAAAASLNGKTISLQAVTNDKYISIYNKAGSKKGRLTASRTNVDQGEMFSLVELGNGYVALKSKAANMFLAVDKNVSYSLKANRFKATKAATFKWVSNDDGTVSFRSKFNGKYVRTNKFLTAGSYILTADRSSIDASAKFIYVVK